MLNFLGFRRCTSPGEDRKRGFSLALLKPFVSPSDLGSEFTESATVCRLEQFVGRRPGLFKERDVRRAAKAVMSVGLGIDRVEITKEGVIVVVPRWPAEPIIANEERN